MLSLDQKDADVLGLRSSRLCRFRQGRHGREGSEGSAVASGAVLGAIGIQMPEVSICRFMVTMDRAGSIKAAQKMVLERKWISSNRTIYGGSGVVPIAERLKDAGYMDGNDRLTGKVMNIVNPSRMVERQD